MHFKDGANIFVRLTFVHDLEFLTKNAYWISFFVYKIIFCVGQFYDFHSDESQ